MTTKSLEAFKESVREDADQTLKTLLPGTKQLIKKCAAKKPEGIEEYLPRIMAVAFLAMAAYSSLTQFIIAFKWFPTLPSMSFIVLAKELFGFVIWIQPVLKVLRSKPEGSRIYSTVLIPFVSLLGDSQTLIPESFASTINSLIFAFGSLSNLRICSTLAIAAKYNIQLPFDQLEYDLEKIGNILVTIIDLVIKTKDESKTVNFYLFAGLLMNIFFIVNGFVKHAQFSQSLADFLADLQDGKLCEEAIELGLESIYDVQYGQRPSTPFELKNLPKCVLPIIKKEETNEKKEEKKEEENNKEKTE